MGGISLGMRTEAGERVRWSRQGVRESAEGPGQSPEDRTFK